MDLLANETTGDTRFQQRLKRCSTWFATIVLFIVVLVLLGWTFDIPFLKSPLSHQVTMNPTSAVTLLLSAFSFLLLTSDQIQLPNRKLIGSLLATIVIVIGLWKLLNKAGISGIEVDHLLFQPQILTDTLEGKLSSMAPNSAVAFILTGTSLLLMPVETVRGKMPAHYIAMIIALLAFFSVVAYIYRVGVFHIVLSYIPMAAHTAISFLLLSLAILFSSSDRGVMKTFTGVYAGSMIARFLVPAAIIVPVILGLLRLYGYWSGLFSTEYGVAILIMSIIIFFQALIWYTVRILNFRDAERERADKALQRSESEIIYNASLLQNISDAIISTDNDFRIVSWNKAAEEMYGWAENEVRGKIMGAILKPEYGQVGREEMLSSYFKNGYWKGEIMHHKRNGDIISVLVSTTAIRREGINTGTVAVIRDITERRMIEERLKQFNDDLEKQVLKRTVELRQLSAHLVDIREQERLRISREIHDELGQQLTGLKMDVAWLSKKTPGDDELVKRKFSGLLGLLDEMVKTVRRISTELRPAVLDDFGLLPAIEWHSTEFEKRFGIKIQLSIPDMELILPSEKATGIFRVYQEALTNIARHAKANTVTTEITVTGEQFILTITDDGKGFDPKVVGNKKTLGLLGIRERIFMMNGQYELSSTAGKGTVVSLIIPL
jgi:PAS domain S-box-containing protein